MFETTDSEVRLQADTLRLIPTPPVPKDLQPVELSSNAQTVLSKRYLRRGADGQPVETAEQMFWRVAYHIAVAENEHGNDQLEVARSFYQLLASKCFFQIRPRLPAPAPRWGSLPPVSCYLLPMTWAEILRASSRPCAMPP